MNYDIIDTIVRTAIDAMRNAYVEHGSIAAGAPDRDQSKIP